VADAFNRLTVIEEVDQGDDGILRRLANPQIAPVKPPVAATEIAPAPPVPAWSRIAPLPEPVPPQPLVPSRPDVEPPSVLSPVEHFQKSGGLLRGRLVHRLLQLLPDIVPGQRAASARRFFAQAAPDWSAQQIDALIKEVFSILDHPDFAPLFGPNSQAEVPIAGTVGDFAVSGQIDRLVVTNHEILIVDYKSNRNPPLDKTQVPVAYLGQMSTYRTALAEVFPDHQIRCALLWTEGPRLMPLPDL
jgi:ATP-dependent helicase/nuclease subunit A